MNTTDHTHLQLILTPYYTHTGDIDNEIEIFRSPNTGGATLVDAQGNRVSVVGQQPTAYGKMVLWDISNVLMSGELREG